MAPRVERRPPGRGVEWEYCRLTIPREFSRNYVTRLLVERAEHEGWEARPPAGDPRRDPSGGAAPQDHPAAARRPAARTPPRLTAVTRPRAAGPARSRRTRGHRSGRARRRRGRAL
ncbi:MAG: DUF5703 family protein [Nocardioides sp.]|uniref:DUF5703 family protein n=1 Tax=Nocardioides sp. TaxID=35761 RepID=UPI0039E3C5D0